MLRRCRLVPPRRANQSTQKPTGKGQELTMQPTSDLSLLTLLVDASIPVQVVMLILLGISILSWTYIFSKRATLKRANEQTRRFEDDFWAGGDLSVLQQAVATRRTEHGALARIFDAGMTEFVKARRNNGGGDALLDGPRRAMRATYQREMDSLESRSEEHTSELQSLMRISYAVFCL